MIGVFRTPKTLLSIYVTALDLPGGLLVCAAGAAGAADEASYAVRHSGKRLEVATLDLGSTLEIVLRRVKCVAGKIRKLRKEAHGLLPPHDRTRAKSPILNGNAATHA